MTVFRQGRGPHGSGRGARARLHAIPEGALAAIGLDEFPGAIEQGNQTPIASNRHLPEQRRYHPANGARRRQAVDHVGQVFCCRHPRPVGIPGRNLRAGRPGRTGTGWAEDYAALSPTDDQAQHQPGGGALDEAIMHADVDQWLLAVQSEDFTEAVSAFMEKRTAVFKGN